jgi:hypothetical protein
LMTRALSPTKADLGNIQGEKRWRRYDIAGGLGFWACSC